MNREQRLAHVFVELADTLIDQFDVIDFLYTLAERSVELLHIEASGLVLADQRGHLRVLASSAEQVRMLELFEVQNSEGPCLDCYLTGEPVVNVGLEQGRERWPRLTGLLNAAGFRSAHALPLRLRTRVVGAMNLFCAEDVVLSDDDLVVGQALADVATIGLLQERGVHQQEVLAEQLEAALNNRTLVEQAMGILAERTNVEADEALAQMLSYARRHGRPLVTIASDLIDGSIDLVASGSEARADSASIRRDEGEATGPLEPST